MEAAGTGAFLKSFTILRRLIYSSVLLAVLDFAALHGET
jgi:hypothetical protein